MAFVTRPGVAFLRQYLKTHPPGTARLVASVRFPTNLRELANLEDDYPGTVFLHTGFQTPIEKGGDRGQFHSKIVLLEMAGTERCIILGSHNWTQQRLARLQHGSRDDPPLPGERHHRRPGAAAHRGVCPAPASEPFSRQRLKFYETIQRDLHRRIGPGSTDSEDFPGFEPMDALVMHAEDATGNGIPRPSPIFIPVRDSRTSEFFPDGRPRVALRLPGGKPAGAIASDCHRRWPSRAASP